MNLSPLPCYGIIPARYASTRFPGKPLADILGKPMFWYVYQRAMLARDPHNADEPLFRQVLLATDDQKIFQTAKDLNVPCVMTSPDHASGTDRVYEAATQRNLPDDALIVNIQGDEPLLNPKMLEALVSSFYDPAVRVATLATAITPERAKSSSQVKVVLTSQGNALYFSRSLIPGSKSGEAEKFLGHIGLYAFRMEALRTFVALPPSSLEKIEGLEQLRLLENGIPIRVVITEWHSRSVDTPEDLEFVRATLENQKKDSLNKKRTFS